MEQKKSRSLYMLYFCISLAVLCFAGIHFSNFIIGGHALEFDSDTNTVKFSFDNPSNGNSETWLFENLSMTSEKKASNALLCPGTNGSFSFDISFISDSYTDADVNVSLEESTGAFKNNVDLLDRTSFRFVVTDSMYDNFNDIPFENEGILMSELPDVLETKMENVIGNNGSYAEPGIQKSGSIYVYWQWPYSAGTDAEDTEFAGYTAYYRSLEGGNTDSRCALSVSMSTVAKD